jgi:hypothetical protein
VPPRPMSCSQPRRPKAPLATLIALLALTACAQALAPAQAGAVITQTTGGICKIGYAFNEATGQCVNMYDSGDAYYPGENVVIRDPYVWSQWDLTVNAGKGAPGGLGGQRVEKDSGRVLRQAHGAQTQKRSQPPRLSPAERWTILVQRCRELAGQLNSINPRVIQFALKYNRVAALERLLKQPNTLPTIHWEAAWVKSIKDRMMEYDTMRCDYALRPDQRYHRAAEKGPN